MARTLQILVLEWNANLLSFYDILIKLRGTNDCALTINMCADFYEIDGLAFSDNDSLEAPAQLDARPDER